MKKIITLLLLSVSLSSYSTNIFDDMDKKTIAATGIHKLSKNELLELSQWIENSDKRKQTESREVLKQEIKTEIIAENKQQEKIKEKIIKENKVKNMGFRKEELEREEIHSSIIGDFTGWNGKKNVFKLENGQIWKPSESSTFYISKRTNPKITIKPRAFNSWSLYVDGFRKGVKVRRIK